MVEETSWLIALHFSLLLFLFVVALECDISLQNNLAVANTKLLRTYGAIDPRVRILVFLIKHWAKSRHLNSPSDGTLSSYGFILCLLHFLQVIALYCTFCVLLIHTVLLLSRHDFVDLFCLFDILSCIVFCRTAQFLWSQTCKPCHPLGPASAETHQDP